MEEVIQTLKRKLPNLSNMDIELIRSVLVNYCISMIHDSTSQKEVFEEAAKMYAPDRRRGRPKKHLPLISPSISELEFNPSDPILNKKRKRRRRRELPEQVFGKPIKPNSSIEE